MLSRNFLLIGGMATELNCFDECWRSRSLLHFNCRSVVWSPSNKECLLSEGHGKISSNRTTFDSVDLSEEFLLYEDACHDQKAVT